MAAVCRRSDRGPPGAGRAYQHAIRTSGQDVGEKAGGVYRKYPCVGRVEQTQPEAAYFTLDQGNRAGMIFFEVTDQARLSELNEPLFSSPSAGRCRKVVDRRFGGVPTAAAALVEITEEINKENLESEADKIRGDHQVNRV